MTVSLLPPNATQMDRLAEAVTARIDAVPVEKIRDVWNVWTCPPDFLPYIAWALSVDRWDSAWPLSLKRQVVAASIKIHQTKGTIGAVMDALDALDLRCRVSEWFQYGGDPYLFKVDVDLQTRGLTEDEIAAIEAVIMSAKNTRSHLDSLTIHLTTTADAPAIGMTCASGEVVTIWPYEISERTVEGDVPLAVMTFYAVEAVTIYPKEN